MSRRSTLLMTKATIRRTAKLSLASCKNSLARSFSITATRAAPTGTYSANLDVRFPPLGELRLSTLIRHCALISVGRKVEEIEWPRWFEAAGVASPQLRGPVFDSSAVMVAAAEAGAGVALAPASMFSREMTTERLVRPFAIEVALGGYWLTRLRSRVETDAMRAFRAWLETDASE
jgi:LysR family transcriptional regulator, regulator of gene expression of beta-lactamase